MGENSSRRSYLARVGTVAGTGALASLAGCTGSFGGGTTTITSSAFPLSGVPRVAWSHAESSGILEEEMEGTGYELSINYTFEGPPLLVSGQTDMAGGDLSAFEASLIAQEQDLEFVVGGRVISNYFNVFVAEGGDWDPENTGSVEATIDTIVEEGDRFGIATWASGDVPVLQLIMDRLYGHDFSEGGDFRINTANYPALPDLVKNGEIAAASSGISINPVPWLEGGLTNLFFESNISIENGWGVPPLGNLVTTREFYEENAEGFDGACRAYQSALNELVARPIEIASQYGYGIDTDDATAGEFEMRWQLPGLSNTQGIPEPREAPTYADARLTNTWIEQTTTFMDEAVSIGQAPENWADVIDLNQDVLG